MADEGQSGNKEEPIIINKKKCHGGHAGSHGAWKVAYSDFVTAMMAFFIVMWVLAQSAPVKKAVEHYFSHTDEYSIFTGRRGNILVDLGLKPSKLGEGKGIEKGKGWGEEMAEIAGEDDEKHQFTFWQNQRDSTKQQTHQPVKEDSIKAAKHVVSTGKGISELIKQMAVSQPKIREILKSIQIEISKEGLRITLIETSESVFFEIGSANLTSGAKKILRKLAIEIGKLPNPVDIEGHTDSRKYSPGSIYSNWELSTDRANATRRFMTNNGLWQGQVEQVTGFADKKLKYPENPFDVKNRRISILVRHLNQNDLVQASK